jgi:predicted O-methyltransferase YrrM
MPLAPELKSLAVNVKGYMFESEGDALYEAALLGAKNVPNAPFLEVGSYCGRSTVWLGGAARECSTVVFAVDHHIGSEEHQPGFVAHDGSLIDPRTGRMDTLPFFRNNIVDAGLTDSVIAVVGTSEKVAKYWSTPLAFLFIDGGHDEDSTKRDYENWVPHVAPNGILALHDVFPATHPPYHNLYTPALESGKFVHESSTESLAILRRA